MAKSFALEVVETSNTTGTGAYALAGIPAGSAYRTFRQEFANGETKIVYLVRNKDNTKWEANRFGTLTYGTPDSLARNVVRSTNGDASVSWVAGDLPLTIYIPADAEVHEGAITGWLATVRHALLRFGHWFKQDDPSAGLHSLKIFDGTSDIDVGVVNTVDHTIAWSFMPAGVVMPYAGVAAPAGFLLCTGQAVSRTTYAALFAIIGTTFGVGDGSTTFNVPDLRGRVAAGLDGGTSRLPGFTALGVAGGQSTVQYAVSGSISGSATGSININANTGASFGAPTGFTLGSTVIPGDGHQHNLNTTVFPNLAVSGTFSGVSDVRTNVQPTIALNHIIKT